MKLNIDKDKMLNEVSKVASNAKKTAIFTENKTKEVATDVKNKSIVVGNKVKGVATKQTKKVYDAMDVNHDGNVDIEDIIILGLKADGIKINREDFLRKELTKKYPEDVIQKAIEKTPAEAGISSKEMSDIADNVIQFERNCVSGISTALGMPGGVSMIATIPADIIQYYGYMLRAMQKLMYLYGFPQINVEETNNMFDSETINVMTLCLGVMYGVAGASNVIKAMAKALGTGVQKQLMRKALTKGTIYPIVKSVSKWFGVKMTKEVFSGFFKKAIPVAGGIIAGGITYVSFKPCCVKLKESLQDTLLSNPNHISSKEENEIYDKLGNE